MLSRPHTATRRFITSLSRRWLPALALLTFAACRGCAPEAPQPTPEPPPEPPTEVTALASEDVCTHLLEEGLRAPGADLDFLDLTIAGDMDETFVAWADETLWVSRWKGGGPWESLPTAPGAGRGAARPSLALDAGGRLLMAWEEDQDSGTGIRVAVLGGETWNLLGGSVGAYAGQGTPASDPVLLGGATPMLIWTEVERGHPPTQGSSGDPSDFPDEVLPEAVPDLLPAERPGQSLWGAWWDGNRWSSGRSPIVKGSDLVSFEAHATRDHEGRPWVVFIGGTEATETYVRVSRFNDAQRWEDVGATAGALLKGGGEVHAPRLVADGSVMWVHWREGNGPSARAHFARFEQDAWVRSELSLPVAEGIGVPGGPVFAQTAPTDVWSLWTEATAETRPSLKLAVLKDDHFERVGSELGQGPAFSGVRSFALAGLGEGALGVVWDAELEGARSVHVARLEACSEGDTPLNRIAPMDAGVEDGGATEPSPVEGAAGEPGTQGRPTDAGP